MRKALVVGIDHYDRIGALYGCVKDSYEVKAVLERHGDGSVNFGVRHLAATSPSTAVARAAFRAAVTDLFAGDSDVALLYFAWHGYIDTTGGFLCASDTQDGNDGLSLHEIIAIASGSQAKNKIIVLDSCHAGIAGQLANMPAAVLSEGMTILTASTAEQYALEENGSGVFTTLFVDALSGAASNLLGEITPGSVYAHIDQSLGPWDQRPVFKTNVKSFVSLRTVPPPLDHAELRRITEFFPQAGILLRLDHSFEPEGPNPDPVNTDAFRVLQKMRSVNLVDPVGAPHMYHAAMESQACKLTVLGEHYRRLVERGLI